MLARRLGSCSSGLQSERRLKVSLIRPVLLTLLVLCLGAAPAQATLLVRSDGAGLLVQDKNGLSDNVVFQAREGGYGISNDNVADLFKFDIQTGCESRAN